MVVGAQKGGPTQLMNKRHKRYIRMVSLMRIQICTSMKKIAALMESGRQATGTTQAKSSQGGGVG